MGSMGETYNTSVGKWPNPLVRGCKIEGGKLRWASARVNASKLAITIVAPWDLKGKWGTGSSQWTIRHIWRWSKLCIAFSNCVFPTLGCPNVISFTCDEECLPIFRSKVHSEASAPPRLWPLTSTVASLSTAKRFVAASRISSLSELWSKTSMRYFGHSILKFNRKMTHL